MQNNISRPAEAVALVEEMRDGDVRPTEQSYKAAIEACEARGRRETGK